MFKKGWALLFLALLLTAASGCSNSGKSASGSDEKTEVVISAAASLTDALDELQSSFEDEYPDIDLTFNFGSSGKLAQQIEQGAPADVFLSASNQDMDKLQEKKLIQKDSRLEFAKNSLVLIAKKDQSASTSSFEEINREKIDHLAMGEPESVPAGRYTKEVLEHLNIWESLQNKLVLGSDVRQVLTYVESGNAELGVVYASDALTSDKVKVVSEAKADWHEPIVYPGAITSHSEHAKEAKLFLDYLASAEGKEVLHQYGFN
ncbi:molybdate ABC transporter substrate-binding protein [Pseudobacillus wudalianchiensis]|uniref:Molybdate ABC transporter substrate-binding protein n=1 Tax=Pseudobacillus wudalianchiensis TaxID=1743143 RepID=A0A1B9AAN3_9BACI|nr:molybdate ABC transporter substrate-binding protein [Bacillus wudalianchiensis]OCA80821.1 molybdate ABC transporter substrate-binding protein [Bacillus wudalianchiensis]